MSQGITFRETMTGPFALGPADPESGAAAGERDDTQLAMHAEVAIDDLAAFIDDPDHRGALTGTVDFPPLGNGLPVHDGVFNLFRPAAEPGLKLMVYEMAFRAHEIDYYLAGEKRVSDDPGFDLWSDTTTLYTTLHEGGTRDGPVKGAGILSLGLFDLTDLLSTMRVTGADSMPEKAATVARFGRFFLGALWDTYAPGFPDTAHSDRSGNQ